MKKSKNSLLSFMLRAGLSPRDEFVDSTAEAIEARMKTCPGDPKKIGRQLLELLETLNIGSTAGLLGSLLRTGEDPVSRKLDTLIETVSEIRDLLKAGKDK